MRGARLPHALGTNRLTVQITLLILASIVVFQSLMIILFHILDVEGRRHIVDQRDFIASVILALDAAPATERDALVDDLLRATPYVNIKVVDSRPPGAAHSEAVDDWDNENRQIISLLWNNVDAFETPDAANSLEDALAVRLRKGGYALVSIAQHEKPPRSVWRWLWEDEPGEPFILTPWARAAFAFFMFTTIFVFWTSNVILGPLKRLARRAEKFPENARRAPLVEQGPTEVRELTRSINRMEDRIRKMIAERAHVLAAVSHDLRTIITRLKLKTDFVSDATLQEKMLRDIDMMDGMLLKNLHYLRAEEDDKADYSLIDLDSVLQTVTNEFCDIGYTVRYAGGQHEMVFGSLSDLQRVFTNLVENAVHHGSAVDISIAQLPDDVIEVDVADDGPGMTDAEKAIAFDPFVRGQPGRTLDTRSGFGLGLSIVRSLVTHHGGSVTLHDRAPYGLVARIRLPRGVTSVQPGAASD